MKILKKPQGIIYDTENPKSVEYANTVLENIVPLGSVTNKTDFLYLRDFFNPNHSIFANFGESYFFFIK